MSTGEPSYAGKDHMPYPATPSADGKHVRVVLRKRNDAACHGIEKCACNSGQVLARLQNTKNLQNETRPERTV